MKSIKCIIVDDSESSIDLIKSYLHNIPFCRIIAICYSYFEAIQVLSNEKDVDLLFLDIELGNGPTGLDLLRTVPHLPPTIITTTHPNYAVDSYTIGKAADYLLKPYEFDRFLLAVNRALEIQITYENFIYKDSIFLKKGRRFQNFEYNNILYFEAKYMSKV